MQRVFFFSTKERNESQIFTLSLKYQSTALGTVVIFPQPLSNLGDPRMAGLIGSDSCYPHSSAARCYLQARIYAGNYKKHLYMQTFQVFGTTGCILIAEAVKIC